ncbi:hypothetical protein [Shewanella surugensis]|uniref:Uncharacterized protein n=1 Tax=Shewanella surugensis TaxID=212020 RepID=A0ABT0L648_9GAMM|nr:hypothetical protein [Shewanella surugensis]MCL1122955.1 hypothetical protein [Shewanella surugensis]
MYKKNFLLMLVLFIVNPLSALAMPIPIASIQQLDFLKNSFSLAEYQDCQLRVEKCPSYQNTNHATCIASVIKQCPSCQQTSQLANFLGVFISQISISTFGQFKKVVVYFPGDGGSIFYLISPAGQLLNTINPDSLKRDDFPVNLQTFFPHKK